jgi:hypothetical protein
VTRRSRYHDWRSENGGLLDNAEARARFCVYDLNNGFAPLGGKIEAAESVEEASRLLRIYLDQ